MKKQMNTVRVYIDIQMTLWNKGNQLQPGDWMEQYQKIEKNIKKN